MMIVFYKQYVSLDPLWHVRHLGRYYNHATFST